MEKARDIDSKFAVSKDGKIYKQSNEEIIPDDEPLFLLRGRDILAIHLLKTYRIISEVARTNEYHARKLNETINSFLDFQIKHSKRMKMPSITEGK